MACLATISCLPFTPTLDLFPFAMCSPPKVPAWGKGQYVPTDGGGGGGGGGAAAAAGATASDEGPGEQQEREVGTTPAISTPTPTPLLSAKVVG